MKLDKKYAVQLVANLIILALVLNLYLPTKYVDPSVRYETDPSTWHSPPALILTSASGTGIRIPVSGSGVETASYIIFTDGTNYYCKNGSTNQLISQSSSFTTEMNSLITNNIDIFITKGTYTFTSTAIQLFLKHHVKITGVGNETIFDRNYASNVPFIDIRSSSDIEISGIYFNGHNLYGSKSYVMPDAITAWFSNNVRLHDLFVTGISDVNAAFDFQSCTDCDVQNCIGWKLGDNTAFDSEGSLLRYAGSRNCTASHLKGYFVRGIVALADGSINNTTPSQSSNIHFSDIYAYNSTSCVWFENSLNCVAENCEAVKCEWSRWTYGAHNGDWGNSFGDFQVGSNSGGIRFIGCVSISGAKGFYANVDNTTFASCMVRDAGYIGVQIGKNSTWISGTIEGLMRSSVIDGIYIVGSTYGIFISNSYFHQIKGNAIVVNGVCNYTTIVGCYFMDCTIGVNIGSANCYKTYLAVNTFLRCATNIANSGTGTIGRLNYDADAGTLITDIG